jgi:hypothetical protein
LAEERSKENAQQTSDHGNQAENVRYARVHKSNTNNI